MQMRRRLSLFFGFALIVVIGVFSRPPIPQDPAYHLFADNRSFAGIPNFLDFISNLPFLLAGIWGLKLTIPGRQTRAFRDMAERWPYIFFFLGIALTGPGSALYHWSPENRTLLWDRLPMTIGFMGIFSATIGDRIRARAGRLCLAPMLGAGIFSVLYWYYGELRGAGDLRPYAAVQFYTLAAVFLLVILFPPRYTHTRWLVFGGAFYLLAKALEILDKPIYRAIGISGHTLKHLAASLAAFCIIKMLIERQAYGSHDGKSCLPAQPLSG